MQKKVNKVLNYHLSVCPFITFIQKKIIEDNKRYPFVTTNVHIESILLHRYSSERIIL